jgi:cell division protein ZapA
VSQQTVDIHILDKDYQVSCPPEETNALLEAAKKLDEQMRLIRNNASVIGVERIAVMAALNLTYEISKIETKVTQEVIPSKLVLDLDEKLAIALQSLEDSSTL